MRRGSRRIGVPALAAALALWPTATEALTFHPTPTFAGMRAGLQNTQQTSPPTSLPYDLHSALRAQPERRVGGQSEICGWVNGNSVDPVSCQTGYYCATASMYVGCCEQTSCRGIITTCYDILGPVCDARCQLNYSNLRCSQTSAPYCAQYVYPSGSVGYGCADVSGYTVSVLLSTVNQFGSLSNPATTTSQSSTVSTVSTDAATSTSLTSSATPVPTTVPSTGGNSLSGGAIAGIVIGGVAVIALICAIVFWRVNQNRRRANMRAPLPGSVLSGWEGTASPAETYPMQDPRTFGGRVQSGGFSSFVKDDMGSDGYHAPGSDGYHSPVHEGYYAPGPDSQQAAFPGQARQYAPQDGGGENGLAGRPNMYPATYAGPTIPEMVGSRPDLPR